MKSIVPLLLLAASSLAPFAPTALAQAPSPSVLPVAAVRTRGGFEIAPGTYRVDVLSRLGRPASLRPDGAMVFRNFVDPLSARRGELVVAFQEGSVRALSLQVQVPGGESATPAATSRIGRTAQRGPARGPMVATR